MSFVRSILITFALITAADAAAQAPVSRIPRVGYCGGFGDPNHIFTKTFFEGMRKRGWEDGRNVRIIPRPPGSFPHKPCGEYMADKALDVLVLEQHVDLHPRVPVVTKLSGVAGSAIAQSRTRNVTGITREHGDWEEDSKRIALIKEAFGANRVLLLSAELPGAAVKPGLGTMDQVPAKLRNSAMTLGVELIPVTITRAEDLLEPALNMLAEQPRMAAIVYDSPNWYKVGAAEEIAIFMLKHRKRLPVMSLKPDWVLARGPIPELDRIMGFGTSYLDEHDRYAYFVDRILRGAKPAELPFEQTPSRLAVNVDAAKISGITFPRSILTQADWVVPPYPQFDWTTTPQAEPPPELRARIQAILRSQ